jgi:hypothetical protein
MIVLLIALGAVVVALLGALLVTVWRYGRYRESHPFTLKTAIAIEPESSARRPGPGKRSSS